MPSFDLIAGRYRIISQLGEGGMGVVYRAWDNDRDVPVVVKMPKADKLADPDFIERFNREIKAMAGLAHPHIVPIVGHGQNEDGRPYVAMRFLPGGSLSDRRRRGQDNKPVPGHPSLLHHWLPAIAEALDFVHRSGVIHRDVKPDNIFFDARWNAFLGDFGIAKVLESGGAVQKDATMTKTGMPVGTYAYLAPEVLGNRAVAASDQYSLAIAVYEMLAGVRPFSGNLEELFVGHLTQLVPSLQDKNPKLPAQLCEAVHKGLSKKPEERFATCAQFAAAVLEEISAPPTKDGVTRVVCPACRIMLDLDEKVAGRSGRCRKCSTPVWVSADLEAVWLLDENPTATHQRAEGKRYTSLSIGDAFDSGPISDAFEAECEALFTHREDELPVYELDLPDVPEPSTASTGMKAVEMDPYFLDVVTIDEHRTAFADTKVKSAKAATATHALLAERAIPLEVAVVTERDSQENPPESDVMVFASYFFGFFFLVVFLYGAGYVLWGLFYFTGAVEKPPW